jgi:hypothetical protein
MTPLQNLAAAIARKTLIVQSKIGDSPRSSQPRTEIIEEEEEEGDDYILGRLSSCIVQQIYQRHKIGRREPNEFFLHVSYRYSVEQPESSKTAGTSPASLDLRNGMILVCANTISVDETRNALLPCLCVYTVEQTNENFDNSKLASVLQEFLNTPRIYFSTREGRYSEAKLYELNNRRDIYLESSRIPRAFFREGGISFYPQREIMDWLIMLLSIDEEAGVIDLTIEDSSDECWSSRAIQSQSLFPSESQDTESIKAEAPAERRTISCLEESTKDTRSVGGLFRKRPHSSSESSKNTKPAGGLFPRHPHSSYESSRHKQRSPADATNAGRSMPDVEEEETTPTLASPMGTLRAGAAKRGDQGTQQSNGDGPFKRRKR